MTERELAQRLHDLCLMADRFRMPDHRRTVEACMAERDEIRNGLRRCYRDLTGSWPAHHGETAATAGPPRRPKLPMPSALARHRARGQTPAMAKLP